MSPTGIASLPEELLLSVFEYLDSTPPSELKSRQEPDLRLTQSAKHVLKDVSCVSKRWRRSVLPLLFRNARLRLDVPLRSEWSQCTHCRDILGGNIKHRGDDTSTAHPDHVAMIAAMDARKSAVNQSANFDKAQEDVFTTTITPTNFHHRPNESSTAAWAARLYHVATDFLEFITNARLQSSIRSIALLSDRMLQGKHGRFPHQFGSREWRYPAAAVLWQHLLSTVEPDRIAILAPPTELSLLLNAAIDTFGDWAFTDMDFHILELHQDRAKAQHWPAPVDYSNISPFPPRHPSFASSSLLHLRPWTHISLNEGSFLKAYGTYEYFERGPPSLVYSIKQCFDPLSHQGKDKYGVRALPALRKLTYTAIFPFANHADFADIVPYLEELDLQFAPDLQSGILDDKKRVGKAELQDCWQELITAYHDLAVTMSTFRMSEQAFPWLERFVCRDSQIPALREELDEMFTPLCMPVWVNWTHGEFERVAMKAEFP